ncbi:MAG: 4Fe-4S binding protein [Chloroflexota bacterium]|nr:4Fe-4S binding protein [Chloroflexota bacterium]
MGSGIYKYRNYLTLTRLSDIIGDGFHVSVCGGILKWEDIIESTLYGAATTQIQSLFLRKGVRVVPRMKQNMLDYMERHNLESLDEIRGLAIEKIIGEEASAQVGHDLKGVVVAVVDEDKCNGCGICEDVCYYAGIKVVDKLATVNKDNCEGCRACVMDCPTGALSLSNVDKIYELARKWTEKHRPEVAKYGIRAQDPRDRKSLGLTA